VQGQGDAQVMAALQAQGSLIGDGQGSLPLDELGDEATPSDALGSVESSPAADAELEVLSLESRPDGDSAADAPAATLVETAGSVPSDVADGALALASAVTHSDVPVPVPAEAEAEVEADAVAQVETTGVDPVESAPPRDSSQAPEPAEPDATFLRPPESPSTEQP
jgi:hypothetical protein